MAATSALLTFSPIKGPNPNFTRFSAKSLPPLVISHHYQFQTLPSILSALDRKIWRHFHLLSSFDESTHADIEVEKEKGELKTEANEAQEAWNKTLETFKEEALKMKEMSEEAYEVYSKKAMEILKETSETLKIQADKAKEDLSAVAKQISQEGKVYLSAAAEKSPDSVKDVVETFAYSTDDLKEMSSVRDFYLGIPYGAFLSVGGFLSFMLTGRISAIRFGVILGGALLALSVASLRSWKSGQSTELFLKGQAAIATIIFIREWRFFCQKRLFSTSLMILIRSIRISMDSSEGNKHQSFNVLYGFLVAHKSLQSSTTPKHLFITA